MPVWLAQFEDEQDGLTFIAAANRHQARAVVASHGWWEYVQARVWRLWSDGRSGGRPRRSVAQVMVERSLPGELSARQLASIGYHACARCEEMYTANPSGLCDTCEDEDQDEADGAMEAADGGGRA